MGSRRERPPLVEARVPPGPGGAGDARRALEAVEPSLPEAGYGAVRLLVSEVVANVRWHPSITEATLGLRVERHPSFVRVEVTDVVPDRDPGEAQDEAVGWDVFLLETLSDRWGVLEGTTSDVWFEIDTPNR